ncbi:DUF551 domain-containing protein [Escherichia coli]|nr:DUF551 domain-containing protein [Escherichia coli]EGK4716274.1 DUF551 domain-containing protein [Escherichia coli]EGK5916410.1 DUF551 domain-containing protein [Escherichia coli]
MNKIDYQVLREAAERAIPAMERLLMLPADDDLLSEQELKDYGVDIDALNAFKFLAGPETVLALLDERERNQQYIKRRDQENEDIALTVGKLRVELEEAKSKLNEQREYYEGVIADGGKRIAELEAKPVSQTYKLNEMSGNSPVIPDGWISCSEWMPNEEDVLVYCSDTKEQMVGFHKGKGLFQFFYMNGVEVVCEPSHWMPLPEPPL